MLMPSRGLIVAILRHRSGMTQKELARRASMGVGSVSDYERDRTPLPDHHFARLRRVLALPHPRRARSKSA